MFTPEGTHVLFMSGGSGALPYMPFMFTFLGKIMNLWTGRRRVVCATEVGDIHSCPLPTVAFLLPRCQTWPTQDCRVPAGNLSPQRLTEGTGLWSPPREPHHTPLREKGWQNGALHVAQWHLGLSLLAAAHFPARASWCVRTQASYSHSNIPASGGEAAETASGSLFPLPPLFPSLPTSLHDFSYQYPGSLKAKNTGRAYLGVYSPSWGLHRCSWCSI